MSQVLGEMLSANKSFKLALSEKGSFAQSPTCALTGRAMSDANGIRSLAIQIWPLLTNRLDTEVANETDWHAAGASPGSQEGRTFTG